ncbi:hypothetical protein HHI36_011672 [Cryptolaemus montrouzieri]|uniref:Uncharacterized protein n=1 Tax=Cryptolaemus montrouzieri TaxID=559131 RepID=A0ABD2MMP8_9CUCU
MVSRAGTHLGLILFLLFINDVKFSFKSSKFLLFADDEIFKRIERNYTFYLDFDLDSFHEWCKMNGMSPNLRVNMRSLVDENSDIEEVNNKNDSDDDYVPHNVAENEYSDIEDIEERELIEQEEIAHSYGEYSGEQNEEEVEIASMAVDSNTALGRLFEKEKNAEDRSIWHVSPRNPTICIHRQNIMRTQSDPYQSSQLSSESEMFRLFFIDEMRDIIVRETNRKAVTVIHQ